MVRSPLATSTKLPLSMPSFKLFCAWTGVSKRSFVKGLGEDIEDTAIVGMVIDLAHVLGMKVVAEGVESAHHKEQLKEMGCDLAQGFYFAEAQAGGEIEALLTSGSLG